MTGINSPATYRKMCEPFANIAEANKATTDFQDELYELRVKHRIKDFAFVAEVNVLGESGDEYSPMIAGMLGDATKMEGLFAFAYGRAAAERQERITSTVSDACKAIRPGKKQ